MSWRWFGCGLLATTVVGMAGAFGPPEKKFIAHGWDLLAVSPEEVLANADAFDETGVDGVTLMLRGKFADGRHYDHTRIMNDGIWPREQLKDKIAVFREIVKHPSLRESFVSSWWAPQKRLKWDDDTAWATFAANMGTVAWLAKEGGLRGILVDGEDYPRTKQYFLMDGDPSYAETAKLARRRGAQVFRAIFDEYPDVTFLSFWMLSLHPQYFTSPDPMGAAEGKGDLWPWFVNGMLDVMPPQARFVDGNEHAYTYKSEKRDFYLSACNQRVAAQGLVAPENRGKYRAQMLAGFGLYMDCYVNGTNSWWYHGPVNGSRTLAFAKNLAQAADACDGYIWVYGEKHPWVHWKGTKSTRFAKTPTWDDVLPGCSVEMAGVKDPLAYVRRRVEQLRAKGKYVNRAREAKRPWGRWQDDKLLQGKLGDAGTGVYLEGTGSGCHIVDVKAMPGDLFAVRTRMKGVGGSSTVYWKQNGRWNWSLPGVPLAFGRPDQDGWCLGEALVRVPDGADTLALQLGARQRAGERVDFVDVEVVDLR